MFSSLLPDEILRLLHRKDLLLKRYEGNITTTVRYFISKGFFAHGDYEDIVQEINLFLLENATGIISKYQGRSKFSSYLTTIIINHCKHLLKSRKYQKNESVDALHLEDRDYQPIPELIIRDEFAKLQSFFDLMFAKKYRLLLCLKVLFHIPCTVSDICRVFPGREKEMDIEELLVIMNRRCTDQEHYKALNEFFNMFENKCNEQDAVRKWTDITINRLIKYMNEEPSRSFYDKETIRYLIEKYFMSNNPKKGAFIL